MTEDENIPAMGTIPREEKNTLRAALHFFSIWCKVERDLIQDSLSVFSLKGGDDETFGHKNPQDFLFLGGTNRTREEPPDESGWTPYLTPPREERWLEVVSSRLE